MGSANVSTNQQQIAELAGIRPALRLTTLHHHMDLDWLMAAYSRTRKGGAVGVDGMSGRLYGEELIPRLTALLEAAKSGTCRAAPVRRTYIPKPGGSRRALGIPGFEDKVLQRAVVMLLEPIYEQDFLDCFYGFRPGRSAHDALEAVRHQVTSLGGCWLIDADISQFLDTMDKAQLRQMLDQRVGDGVVRRLIGKWLHAGVMEDGQLSHPETGSPQGGVISPLLSNIYLHHVLDVWFATVVMPRLHGRAFLVRYADDFVIGCELRSDAQRVMAVLPKRFAKYGLTIHPEKTRMIRFYPPTGPDRQSGTFDFLGFTHHWGLSHRGNPCVRRRTMGSRLRRLVARMSQFCRRGRCLPVAAQQQRLCAVLRGHYQYYGLTGNYHQLRAAYRLTCRVWRHWPNRRSRTRSMPWNRFQHQLDRFPLPTPRVVHSIYRPANRTA